MRKLCSASFHEQYDLIDKNATGTSLWLISADMACPIRFVRRWSAFKGVQQGSQIRKPCKCHLRIKYTEAYSYEASLRTLIWSVVILWNLLAAALLSKAPGVSESDARMDFGHGFQSFLNVLNECPTGLEWVPGKCKTIISFRFLIMTCTGVLNCMFFYCHF